MYCTVSSEYVENVVYPPKKPVMINKRNSIGTKRVSNNLYKKPINNDPKTLTNNVPAGKFILIMLFINCIEIYLDKAPNPPPIKTDNKFITHFPYNGGQLNQEIPRGTQKREVLTLRILRVSARKIIEIKQILKQTAS
jgi:hypothetical protein